MGDNHGLTKENLLRSLPVSLAGDSKMLAMAEAMAGALAERLEEISRVSVYPRINELDAGLLDILARDFKVDWWDSGYSLEEKRRTLLTSWQVHKTLGTKAAVETAIRAIYPHTHVREWFDYGGEPYHFRLEINVTDDEADSAKQRRVLKRLQYYKNLRSHLDGVTYFLQSQALAPAGACFLGVHGRVGAAAGPQNADWPRVKTGLKAGGVYLGQHLRLGGSITAAEPRWPEGRAGTGVGAALLGSYQKIDTHQKASEENGTLE